MSREHREHSHASRRRPREDEEPGGFDWFAVLDVAVWVSVAVIAVIGIEWLIGKVIRESLAAGAAKHLRSQAEAPTEK